MKTFIGVVIGVVLGGIAVALIEYLGHYLFPVPDNFDATDMDQLKAYIDEAPIMALIFVPLSHFLGALVAGFTAFKISRKALSNYIAVGILLLATVTNVLLISVHPVWLILIDIFGVILAGILIHFGLVVNNAHRPESNK